MVVFRVSNQDERLFGTPERIERRLTDWQSRVEPSRYQQCRHCYILNVRSESDGRHTNGQSHDRLHAGFRRESPGRASASASKGGNGPAGMTQHADARYIGSIFKPRGKRIYDGPDVVRAISHALGNTSASAGRTEAVK